jgi:hypothetical protein
MRPLARVRVEQKAVALSRDTPLFTMKLVKDGPPGFIPATKPSTDRLLVGFAFDLVGCGLGSLGGFVRDDL